MRVPRKRQGELKRIETKSQRPFCSLHFIFRREEYLWIGRSLRDSLEASASVQLDNKKAVREDVFERDAVLLVREDLEHTVDTTSGGNCRW